MTEREPAPVQPVESVRRGPHVVRLVLPEPNRGFPPGQIELEHAATGYVMEVPLTEEHLRMFYRQLRARYTREDATATQTNMPRPPGYTGGPSVPRREGR